MSESRSEDETERGGEIRLQRVLASAGVGSRRHCEDLIAAGRVSIDGVTVDRQGVRVDPEQVVIRVDGERVVTDRSRRYLLLNKPTGVVTTMHDEQGRPAVGDAVRDGAGLFHVGRLDVNTEGLLLLTNDGELGHRLMHPSYQVPKLYLAEVEGRLTAADRKQLLAGVALDDGLARADKVRILEAVSARSAIEVQVHEGRNRLVRRMLEAVDHPVRRLVRVRYAGIWLGDLRAGRTRSLTSTEVAALHRLVDM